MIIYPTRITVTNKSIAVNLNINESVSQDYKKRNKNRLDHKKFNLDCPEFDGKLTLYRKFRGLFTLF